MIQPWFDINHICFNYSFKETRVKITAPGHPGTETQNISLGKEQWISILIPKNNNYSFCLISFTKYNHSFYASLTTTILHKPRSLIAFRPVQLQIPGTQISISPFWFPPLEKIQILPSLISLLIIIVFVVLVRFSPPSFFLLSVIEIFGTMTVDCFACSCLSDMCTRPVMGFILNMLKIHKSQYPLKAFLPADEFH